MKANFLILLIVFFVFSGCEKDITHGPLVKTGGTVGVPTNLKTESLPGAIKIQYVPPAGDDFLYVEAMYTSRKGEKIKAKSSEFKNFILLEGFADVSTYQIDLVAVSRSEDRSPAVSVTAAALPAPIYDVYSTIAVREDFGGVNIKFTNEAKAEYVLYTIMKDSADNWREVDRLYTKAPSRDYSVRGLDAKKSTFGLYLRDKWGNHSDTLLSVLTPLFEEFIKKDTWRLYALPGDSWKGHFPYSPIENVWNGKFGPNQFFIGLVPSDNSIGAEYPFPYHFTIDLGVSAQFSRLVVFQYTESHYEFALGNPRKYEIWGTNSRPDPSGSYDGWTKLLSCQSVKPSGSPLGVSTQEDLDYARSGEEYTFPLGTQPVRYVRFRTLETWAAPNLLLDEISFYGDIKE